MHIGGIILLWSMVLYEILYSISFADTDFKCCEIWGSHGSDWRLLSRGMRHLLVSWIVTNMLNAFRHDYKTRISWAWEKSYRWREREDQRFKWTLFMQSSLFPTHDLLFSLEDEGTCSSETSVTIYQATHCNFVKDGNVRSRKVLFYVYLRTLSLLLRWTLDYLHVDLRGALLKPCSVF
jgi:hypothetical protein